MKNSNDSIENRTSDIPACVAVLQTNAPPYLLHSFFSFFSKHSHEKVTVILKSEADLHSCSDVIITFIVGLARQC